MAEFLLPGLFPGCLNSVDMTFGDIDTYNFLDDDDDDDYDKAVNDDYDYDYNDDDGNSTRRLRDKILPAQYFSRKLEGTIGLSTHPLDRPKATSCQKSSNRTCICMPVEGRMSVYVQGTNNGREVKSEVFKMIQQGMDNNNFVEAHECVSKIVFVGAEDDSSSSAAPKKSLASLMNAGYLAAAVIFGVVGVFASLLFVKMYSSRSQGRVRDRDREKNDTDVDYDDGTLSSFDEHGICDRDLFKILGVDGAASMLFDPSTASSSPSAEAAGDQETVVASNTARHVRKMRRRRSREEALNNVVEDEGLGSSDHRAPSSMLDRGSGGDESDDDKYGSFDFFDLILENGTTRRPTTTTTTCSDTRTGESQKSEISEISF
eukprot:CAMPEP_0197238092 /NCGR_PEP_ID=MMETSP1429-20130617/4698_1 /TAXON_ID=49237 /ORGANISM="Chaetoceros  sp., Strain UNC1202" /LENGTH=374 /DNA_ID=CAMNT_0042697191 /DNA_START=18 /DNA_END=1142 /DNA_ORIENTATION=+